MLLIKLIIFLPLVVWAKLPELSTKQSLGNIRFISLDGKITYYQIRSGALSITSNYKNQVLLKSEMNTQYFINTSASRKKMTIEMDNSFHQNYNLLKLNKIFISNFGGIEAQEIGDGRNPQLHLDDTWLSYYDPMKREITLQFLNLKERKIIIPITNKINPYFIPDVVMLNPETILYTDLNSFGKMGVMKYNHVDKKYINVIKSEQNGIKIELCLKENNLLVGQFSYPTLKRGSSISRMKIDASGTATSAEVIYSSVMEDPGNIICNTSNDKIYFVKAISKGESVYTEVAEINIKTKQLAIVSDLKYVAQVISMDQRILIPFQDKFFVIAGSDKVDKDEFKKR